MTALMQRYPDQRSDISANYSTINKLGENGNYYYEVDSNPTTRALECLFFLVHKSSMSLFIRYSTVLVIDATYKTNRYGMPMVQIVGNDEHGFYFRPWNCFHSSRKEGAVYLGNETVKTLLLL